MPERHRNVCLLLEETGPAPVMAGKDILPVTAVVEQRQVLRISHQGPGIFFMVFPQGIQRRQGQKHIPQRALMHYQDWSRP
jgi:hypothetical protein